LGPQYAGSRISRDAIDEDDDDDPFNKVFDDEALEEDDQAVHSGSDELQDDEEALDGLHGSSEGDMMSEEEDYDSEEGEEDSQAQGETSGTEFSDDDDDEGPTRPKKLEQDGTIDRAELRKLMAQDQKSVAATLTEGAKADADKGKAVKAQRAAFDSLLNTRIKLQKAIISANSLSAIEVQANEVEEAKDVVSAAEDAALKLWNNINALISHP